MEDRPTPYHLEFGHGLSSLSRRLSRTILQPPSITPRLREVSWRAGILGQSHGNGELASPRVFGHPLMLVANPSILTV